MFCFVATQCSNAVIPLLIDNLQIEWRNCTKCHDVYVANCRAVKFFDINSIKRSFYTACNCTFITAMHDTSELAILVMQEISSSSVVLSRRR